MGWRFYLLGICLLSGASQAEVFTPSQAKANLNFALTQYTKMMQQVEARQHLQLPVLCQESLHLCTPRALHGDDIQMAVPGKWTNGFYPGAFWKLLSVSKALNESDTVLRRRLQNHAVAYQQRIYPEVWRTDTHDLGFIAYDSFAEALDYPDLPAPLKHRYTRALNQARESLYQRYRPEYGVVQSWDWLPAIKFPVRGAQGIEPMAFDIAQPWQLPVIIDNMMNLELLLTSSQSEHQQAAISHGQRTIDKHYFTLEREPGLPLTIAYHLYDHQLDLPGNWQGLGNHSAWSRGQGWSLYGFATLLAYPEAFNHNRQRSHFMTHTQSLVSTLESLLVSHPVPDWDFFAADEDANNLVIDDRGLTYSPMQDLCPRQLDEHILPYKGYQPLALSTAMLTVSARERLMLWETPEGKPLSEGDLFYPCGRESIKHARDRAIPKDTSAAALIAAGLYRLALNPDWPEKQQVTALADRVMAALTKNYLSHRAPESSAYQRGFLLMEATGNMPAAGEIDTGIIYADFYFIEANQLKLRLSK
ncbi:hypothetical protein HMF8227_02580 [Saliniradius amylolyticus]|uniref:Unsaturated chondroitin disaccharide hydrolase n=1 Tax=Saliniradius amylolyticus TaxID=2183582 RepID=A0A2S2E675_9ALTE|nr:glycoside hydrolase family 88 protein [Saliniradius amylolyticus]AWL13032.1 hypothetical protein HMF8227_02580 [Saliniradius amylolyticus]